MPLQAQTANDVELLRKQLRELQESFTKQQEQQRQQVEALTRQIEALQARPSTAPPPAPPALGDKPKSPAAPLQLLGSPRGYLNLSLNGLFAAGGSTASDIGALQGGAHDPSQRGFTVQNIEATFDGVVDPYLRAQASLIYQISPAGESTFEVEEAFMESLSLPGNLQLKAGQFFTEFGRLNAMHPHAWDFVDQPLVNSRFLGGDGLRNPGVRLSWLVPTPYYSELFLAVQNSQGETAASFRDGDGTVDTARHGRILNPGGVRALNDLLFTPRYTASFELSGNQTLLVGASGAFGPNSTGRRTEIYGLDAFWKWKPANHHGGFPFVSWQTEAMLRRYKAGAFTEDSHADLNGDGVFDSVPRELLTDYGLYSQVAWGFRRGWVAGLRGDYVTRARNGAYESIFGTDAQRDTRWRVSPSLTWMPSDFSKIRLQYNYDRRSNIGTDHSIWLQFEFLLGAHAAHKF
jgi:hypothetical protein